MPKTILIAAAATTALLALSALPEKAQARDYPYCAINGGWDAYENCGYYTIGQCRAAVSGVGGYCIENPRYFANRTYADDDYYEERRPRRRVR